MKILEALLDPCYGILSPQPYVAPEFSLGNLELVDPELTNLEEWKSEIGKKIDPTYADGTKSTFMQQYRTISWSAFVVMLGVSGAIEMSFPGSLKSNPWKAAVHLGTVASLINSIVASCMTDLNSPQERQAAIDKLANKTFSEIAETRSRDDVIGYALLHSREIAALRNTFAAPILYKKYDQLYTQFRNMQEIKQNSESRVESDYSANGGTLESRLTRTKTTKKKDAEGRAITKTIRPDTNPSGSFFGKSSWRKNQAELRLTEWVDWREVAKELIRSKYNEAISSINQAFKAQKDEVMLE